MANSDFFLDFGSNAGTFSKQLVEQLTPARRAVRGLIADLEKLNGTSASPRVSFSGAEPAAETHATGGGATEPAEIARSVQGMDQHFASATAELERFMSSLGSMVARMGQAGDAYKAAVAKQNREVSQQLRQANPHTASLRDPNTGQIVASGTPGGIVHPRTGQPIGQQASIPGTARVLVDEAAFNRVVQAVERNVDATRAVEQAINRLNARGGTPGTPAPSGGGEAQAVDPEQMLAAMKAELAALKAETAEIEADTKDRKQTRADKKAARRDAAAAERAGTPDRLPAQERADRRRDIELAGSEESLRGLQKRDLQRIAGTFTSEGYNTPFNTKTTKDQFVQSIRGSRQQYEAAGEVTKNDLSVSAKVAATEVSKAVRPMVDAILKAAQQIEGESEAYATRRLDRLTGGQDTRVRDAAGRERSQRGQVQRGAAFGGDLDQVIAKAEQTIAGRNERISNAAIEQAMHLAQRPGFDPYSPQLRQGIQGRGEEAVDARFGLAKLTAATEAIDKVGAEVIQLDERLNKAQRALAAMTREADYFAGKQKLSANEVARYTELLARIPQQEARVQTHQARLGDIQGSEAFLTPEYRQGLRARQESQQTYAAARETQASRRALDKATSPFQAALDTLVGSTTGLGSASGQRTQFTRLLPGLTTRGRGATRGLGFTDPERDIADLQPLTKAFGKYGKALRELETEKTGDADPAKLVELDREVAQRLHNIIETYEKVMGTKLPTAEVEGLRTYGRPQQAFAVEQEQKANRTKEAEEARQRKALRDKGANLIDPATLTADDLRAGLVKQRAARTRVGGKPSIQIGSEDLAGPSSTAERNARELAGARETLAKAGVRFSTTLNSSLNEAKNLDDLLKRLNKAIRDGTLQISAYHPKSRTEPGVIGSYANVAAQTGNFGADPAVLQALEASVRSKTRRAAAPAAASTPEQDDAFTEVNQLRHQIDQRRRLAALRKELARTNTGGDFDPQLFATAAAGSKRLAAAGAKSGYTGEDYQARVQKAITSLVESLKGVPRIRQLEQQLVEAIARTGTPEGRRPSGGAGGTGGTGGGRGGTTAGGAEPPGGGGRNDDRIVQVLNAIHATIKAGIRVTPGRAGERRPRTAPQAPTAPAAPPRSTRQPTQYSTKAGRESFVQGLDTDTQALIRGATTAEDKLAAAVALVTKGILNQKDALAYFRSEMKLGAKAAGEFENKLRAALGDTRLQARAQSAAQRQKLAAQQASQSGPSGPTGIQGLQAEQLADTLSRLEKFDQEGRKHVQVLGEMARAGASATEIARQQLKVYQALAATLGKAGFKTPAINQRASAVFKDAGAPSGAADVRNIAQLAKNSEPDLKAQGQKMGESLRGGVADVFGAHGFWNRVIHSTGTFIIRNFSAGFVFGLTNALQQALQQAIETEAAFVKVSSSLEATGRSTAGLRTDLQQISTDYGVALQDVYETTANLVGLFNTPLELAGAARVVAQMQLISRGALNAQEATTALASITASFGQGDGVQGLQHIADVLTVIQERVGVNIETTAEGVARLAGLAQQVGLSFEETSVFVGEIAKKTGQTGAAAGEQFSRIIATLQTGRGREVLQDVFQGKNTGVEAALSAREYGDVIKIVMENYAGLTKAQQDNIAVTLGGQRQAAAINALFADGAKTLDTLTAAQQANGQAASRAEQIQQVLNAQIAKFGQNITNLASNVLRSGIADSFVLILQLVNKLLGGINTVLSTINDFGAQNPLVGFLQRATLGMVGLAIAIVLVRKAMAGLRGALRGGGDEDRGTETQRTYLKRSRVSTGEDPAPTTTPGSTRAQRRREARDDAREAARLRREAAQKEQGTIRGALSAGYEGGALRAQARQQALLDSAERQRVRREERAALRRDQTAERALDTTGLTARERFARTGRVIGAGATTPIPQLLSTGMQRIPGAARALEGSTRLAAGGMGKLSAGLTAMSGAAGAATGVIGAFAIGILLLFSELDKRAEYAKRAKEASDAVFGPDAGQKTAEQAEKDRYVGPSTTIRDKDLANAQTKMGALGLLGGTYFNQLTGKGLVRNVAGLGMPLVKQTFDNVFRGGGDEGARLSGKLPDEYYDRVTEVAKKSFGEFKTKSPVTYGQTPYAPGYRPGQGPLMAMTKTQGDQVKDILKAQESANNVLKDAAAQADADKSLSDQQRVAFKAHLEQIRLDNAVIAKGLILKAQGLGDVDAMTVEQVKQVDEIYSSIAQVTSQTASQYDVAISTAIKSVGTRDGSKIKPILDKLAKGGLTQVEQLTAAQGLAKGEADAMQAEYVSLQGAGVEKEQVDEARALAFQKIAQVDQLAQQILAAEIQAAQQLTTLLQGRGDYAGAERSLEGAIANLRAEANKPGTAKDRKVELENQANQLAEQETDIRVEQATRGDQLARSQTQNQVTGSQLELSIAKKTLTERQKAFKSGGATQQQVDQAQQSYNQALQGYADSVQAQTQSGYAAQGAATLNAVSKAQIEHAAAIQALAYAQAHFGVGSQQYNSALASFLATGQAFGQAIQDQTQSLYQLQAARTNDPVGKARIEMSAAAQNVEYSLKTYGADSVQYNNAVAAMWSSRLSYAQSEEDQRQSEFAVRAARTMNAVAKANIEAAAADEAYRSALAKGDRTGANNALAQKIAAQQSAQQAAEDQRAAARDTALSRIAPGDAVAIASKRLANARAAQQDARKYGTASTQYQQATQQVIEAVRAADDAVADVLKANYDLAIALADASGRTVDSARLRYAEARKAWLRARQKSGGRDTAEVKNAKASEVQAGAAYRDALLQDKLDTIDFNQQMGTLTSQGAIAALQKILKATNLTQQQRRDLMLKIKGLQDDLRSNLTASGFNIPDQIKLPTPYEVRKSLGVDKYIKNFRATLNKAIGTNTTSAAALNAAASPAAIAPTAAAGASNSTVVAALDSVRQAVVANGAQITNDIAITNQVATPAMVDLIAKKVVELISTSTAMGARANQASPKLVSY